MTVSTTRDSERQGTESARRVADVLLALTGGPASLGVVEIARGIDVSPTVTHRILQSLASRDLVTQDPHTQRYRLGSAAIAIGARAIADVDLAEAARPVLEHMVRETNETATVSALTGTRRVYLAQVLPDLEVKWTVDVGRAYSLRLASSGRAILAFLPQTTVDAVLAEPVPAEHGPEAALDTATMLERLAAVRRDGVAVSRGERLPGAAGVAAPVIGVHGSVVGAVNVIGPAHRFTDEAVARYRPLLVAAAARVTENLRAHAGMPSAESREER